MSVQLMRKPPLTFVDWEVGVNLREMGWSRRTVDAVIRKHRLKDGEAVIFFNNSRMFGGGGSHTPKARIYWVFNGQGLVIIPPVDKGSKQVSYQLLLSEWLRQTFSRPVEMNEVLNWQVERRAAALEAAKKRQVG